MSPSRRRATSRCATWQVAHAESFAGASPCAPHSRAGRGVRSPPRPSRARTAMPCRAPRRWRGGAMGTSRPTAKPHERCARPRGAARAHATGHGRCAARVMHPAVASRACVMAARARQSRPGDWRAVRSSVSPCGMPAASFHRPAGKAGQNGLRPCSRRNGQCS